MEIVITWYKDWMKDQVISMFENEYQVERSHFERLFDQFYFQPYQQDKCILVVAVDDKKVAGFQSFFYWPYVQGNNRYNSFQSGNSLVHPDYRGKGIFQKMLAFINTENKTLGIDFLMGFPVTASYKNFIKDKWQNILNLKWFVKISNPFGFLNTNLSHIKGFVKDLTYFNTPTDKLPTIRLSADKSFINWQQNYMPPDTYYSFVFEKNGNKIILHLKRNKRKKLLNELIIGNILFNQESAIGQLQFALEELKKKIRNSFSCHFISVAINEDCKNKEKSLLLAAGFKKTQKATYFIIKPFNVNDSLLDPKQWELYRSDIDTW